MLSDAAALALSGIEGGAKYNTSHTTARELISAGYASDDWGQLGLTEAGRIYLRRGLRRIHINADDDHVSDMSVHMMQIPADAQIDRTPVPYWKNYAVNDPMMSPQHVLREPISNEMAAQPMPDRNNEFVRPGKSFKHKVVQNTPVVFKEPPAEPLPIAESRKQEMLRAAGVASGKTGVWPDERWVNEFVRALDGVLEADGTKQENTP